MKLNKDQSGFGVIETVAAFVIVILIAGVGFYLWHRDHATATDQNSKNIKTTAVNSYEVNLGSTVTVTFPCKTHALSDKYKKNNIPVYVAACQAPLTTQYKGFTYTAIYQDFTNNKKDQLADFNYCTAQTTYPGAHKGYIIYITNPYTKAVDGRTFSVCESSEDKNLVYEVRASAINGNGNILLQIDATPPTDTATLQSDINNFIENVRFN